MIRKRVEQTDDRGRTVTTVVEEPDETTVQDYREDTVSTVERGAGYGLATMIATLSWLVGLAGIAVLALLGLRLAFQAGNANLTSFVEAIYNITDPLVRPFRGIADARSVDGGGVFQPEIVIAMGVYLVATAFVMMAMHALAGMAEAADEGPATHRTRLVHGH